MSRPGVDLSTAHPNADSNGSIQSNLPPQKNNFWIGTMVGVTSALTVTSAIFAGYIVLAARRYPSNIINTSTSAVAATATIQRYSWDWWRHQLATMMHPSSVSSADFLQLQQQQQEAAAAATAATTATIVNTSVQTAIEQFQKELQMQLIL